MSRTISARIPTKMHDELRERCNLIGESINDFIIACLEVGLYNTTNFDFGEELLAEMDEKSQSLDNNY